MSPPVSPKASFADMSDFLSPPPYATEQPVADLERSQTLPAPRRQQHRRNEGRGRGRGRRNQGRQNAAQVHEERHQHVVDRLDRICELLKLLADQTVFGDVLRGRSRQRVPSSGESQSTVASCRGDPGPEPRCVLLGLPVGCHPCEAQPAGDFVFGGVHPHAPYSCSYNQPVGDTLIHNSLDNSNPMIFNMLQRPDISDRPSPYVVLEDSLKHVQGCLREMLRAVELSSTEMIQNFPRLMAVALQEDVANSIRLLPFVMEEQRRIGSEAHAYHCTVPPPQQAHHALSPSACPLCSVSHGSDASFTSGGQDEGGKGSAGSSWENLRGSRRGTPDSSYGSGPHH